MPALREGIEEREWRAAEQGIEVIAAVLNELAATVEQAVATLR
jgi:hypothetical protein